MANNVLYGRNVAHGFASVRWDRPDDKIAAALETRIHDSQKKVDDVLEVNCRSSHLHFQ